MPLLPAIQNTNHALCVDFHSLRHLLLLFFPNSLDNAFLHLICLLNAESLLGEGSGLRHVLTPRCVRKPTAYVLHVAHRILRGGHCPRPPPPRPPVCADSTAEAASLGDPGPTGDRGDLGPVLPKSTGSRSFHSPSPVPNSSVVFQIR